MTIIIYAFDMQHHRSIYGAKVVTIEQALKRLETAINKGAQVISVRIYR